VFYGSIFLSGMKGLAAIYLRSYTHSRFERMKDCCKTGDEEPPKKGLVWLRRLLFATIALLLVVIFFEQITI
jgi:hypothetical protein